MSKENYDNQGKELTNKDKECRRSPLQQSSSFYDGDNRGDSTGSSKKTSATKKSPKQLVLFPELDGTLHDNDTHQ